MGPGFRQDDFGEMSGTTDVAAHWAGGNLAQTSAFYRGRTPIRNRMTAITRSWWTWQTVRRTHRLQVEIHFDFIIAW